MQQLRDWQACPGECFYILGANIWKGIVSAEGEIINHEIFSAIWWRCRDAVFHMVWNAVLCKKEGADPDSSGKPFKKKSILPLGCLSKIACQELSRAHGIVISWFTLQWWPGFPTRWMRHWQTELVPGSGGTRCLKSIRHLILYQISGINLSFTIRKSLHLLTKCVVLELFTFRKTIIPQNMLIIFNHIFGACSFFVLVDMNSLEYTLMILPRIDTLCYLLTLLLSA